MRFLLRTISLVAALIYVPLTVAEELNLYSARHYDTDFALYDNFTKQTGIKINLIEGGSDALIERIVNEGELSPADILITVDAGRLWRAVNAGVFQSIESETLEQKVPENLRHPDNLWFGLSKRARIIAYRKGESFPAPERYEDLSVPDYRGRVCMRSSSNIYNLSLLSSMLETRGEFEAVAWASGVAANFARSPQGNDTAQLRAVASGECGVTVANTYYVGRLLGSDKAEDKEVIANLEFVFPNQDDRGAHVNISGAGVTKHAPNKEAAIKFIEYLTSAEAQRLFAEGNNEYPILGEVTGPISQLGTFKEDEVNASVFGEQQQNAVKTFDIAGWR